MDYLEANPNEDPSNLKNSAGISPSVALPRVPSDDISQLNQEAQTFSTQNINLPSNRPQVENGPGTNSNYSSINNLLPCADAENSIYRSKRDGEGQKAADKSQFSSMTFQDNFFSKNFDTLHSRTKTAIESNMCGERLSVRNSSKPPLKPSDVAKGLSALHSRVDDLLRRKMQPRASSTESERPQRALSSDSRPSDSSQYFVLNPSPKDQPTSAQNSVRNFQRFDFNTSKHDLSILSNSILSNDEKEASTQMKSQKVQPTIPSQDLSISQKSILESPKHVTPSKSELKTDTKPFGNVEPNNIYSESKVSFKQEQTPVRSIRKASEEMNNNENTQPKPKYDEHKLEAIISRIKERNSMSPAPKARTSVPTEPQSSQRSLGIGSWSTSGKFEPWKSEQKEVKKEEQNPRVSSNWAMNKEEKSIEEIPGEKDHNSSGNTTILELFEKKRSASTSKYRESHNEEESSRRITLRLGRTALNNNENQPSSKRQKGGNGKVEGGNLLQDILKDLHIEKPIKIIEAKKLTETSNEKQKSNMLLMDLDLKERVVGSNVEIHKSPCIVQREVVGERRLSVSSSSSSAAKSSIKGYGFPEENIKNIATLSKGTPTQGYSKLQPNLNTISQDKEPVQNRAYHVQQVMNLGERISRGMATETYEKNIRVSYEKDFQMEYRQQSLDKAERLSVKLALENASHYKQETLQKSTAERGRDFVPDYPQNVYRNSVNPTGERSPINQNEEDSLVLDESNLSAKQGELMSTCRQLNFNEIEEASAQKPFENKPNVLDTTAIRNKFLQDEGDISDFDFDRSRLDTQELEKSKDSIGGYKARGNQMDDGYGGMFGAKRQKIMERELFPTDLLGMNDRTLNKTEIPRRAAGRHAI